MLRKFRYIWLLVLLLTVQVKAEPIKNNDCPFTLTLTTYKSNPIKGYTDQIIVPNDFVPKYVSILNHPKHGKINKSAHNYFEYQPNDGYTGEDTIICELENSYGIKRKVFTRIIVRDAPTTEGTEFWLSFMRAVHETGTYTETTVTISTTDETDIQIQNPITGWKHNAHLPKDTSYTVNIPFEHAYIEQGGIITQKGLQVVSVEPIAVYAANYEEESFDVTNVLPTQSVGSEYMIQTEAGVIGSDNNGDADVWPAEFLVVAMEDDVEVTIIPSVAMDPSPLAPTTYSLKRGETVLCEAFSTLSATGSTVDAHGKKVAVFAGSRSTLVPNDAGGACDHLFEQVIPNNALGKEFIVTGSLTREWDFVYVTALYDNTEVLVDGKSHKLLNRHQTDTVIIYPEEPVHFVKTSKSVACYLYTSSHCKPGYQPCLEIFGTPGDPAMVYVPPYNQRSHYSIFKTYEGQQKLSHFVNIVTPTNSIDSMYLDEQSIAYLFSPVPSIDTMSYARIPLEYGIHKLVNNAEGFVAHAYGFIHYESYAYNIASQFSNLWDTTINVVDTICVGEHYYFQGKYYSQTGHYESMQPWSDTVWTLDLTVMETRYDVTDSATVCTNDSYQWHGRTYTDAGTYTDTLLSVTGCDSVTHLVLTKTDKVRSWTRDTICQGDTYSWNGRTYKQATKDSITLTSAKGCDSIAHLELFLKKRTTSITQTSICQNESFTWYGKVYNTPGTYRDTIRNVAGCDSVMTLRITLKDCSGPSGEGQDSIDHPINPMPFLPIRDTLDTTICEHTSLFYREKWYSEPGTYNDTLRYWFGPDSIIYTLILDTKCCDCETYSVLDTTIIFDTLQVHPLDWFGETYIMPGVYQDTIHGGNTQGGDSIGSLLLRVIYEDSARVCNDEPYTFTTPWGEYTLPDGCDCLTGDIVKTADNESIVWAQLCVTRLQPTDSTTIATICEGESFNWYGHIYTTSKDTSMTLTNAAGCDSICELHLTVLPKTYGYEYQSTCTVPYIWHGKQAADGDTIVLQNANGCDSIVTLHLTILAPTDSTTTATICEGESFNWYGHIYKESKDTSMTLTNAAGCDSVCTLHLTVLPKTYSDTVASTCSMPYYWHGKQANDGDTIVLKNANGCDSIVTLRLTVLQQTDSITIATICEGETFNWYGHIYKESKTTTMTLTNAAGCDSICTLRLTVLPVTRQRFGRSICEGTTTTWRGRVLDKAGTYDTILYYVNGCDSIRDTLDLTIDEMYRDSVAYKICQGEHITWRGNTYTNAGDYSVHAIGKNGDCDSILKLHIDVALPTRLDTALYRCYSDPFPFSWEGYSIKRVGDTVLHTTNKAGCDSAIYVTVYQSPEPYTIDEDSSFCDGSYIENWHGKQIWNGGTYYATEKCKNPHFATCDSINYVLHVTKKQPTHGDTTIYVCACEMPIQMNFQGKKRTLDSPGTYNIFDLTNVAGCDSTLTLTIKVSDEVKTDIIDTTICAGSAIQWQGRTIDQEGHYYDTTKCKDIHFLRCDSIYHELHVTIAHHSDSVTYATICRGETFEWHGETYTETTHRTITIDNAAGCDSVCTLHLTVNEPSSSLTTASICMGQTYQWNGYSFTNSVDTTIQLLNSVGCDSLCRLVLTAAVCCPDTQMRRTVIPSMCDTLLPYKWQTWRTQPILINNPGSYADTLRNKWGCDSIIYTLDIDFHHCCRDLKGEMNVGDVCADDDYLSLSLDLHSGMMNEYRLHFTNPTLNKMPIRDTVVHLSEEDWATGTIHIDIPIPHDPEDSTRYPRPDNYFVDVLVSDSCGNTLRWEQVPFTIFYPSWLILQRWNDVLALYNEKYNGGYTFSQIRWFHEDTLLTARGEHDGYIYVRPTLEYGTPYYAELTRTDDGKTFPTCAYFPRPQRDTIIFKEEVEISHNLIGPGANRIGVKTNTNGTYDIYDIGGHCVQHGYFGAEHDALYIDFNTRLPEGVYILLFRGKELLQPEKLIHDKE